MINVKTQKPYSIAIAGTGYVGLSLATLLAQHNHVVAVDVLADKVEKINNKISPIQDNEIERYLTKGQTADGRDSNLDLTATLDGAAAYSSVDFVIIATPTNYDSKRNFFDTQYVEQAIDLVFESNKCKSREEHPFIVIKSTIPVGYTKKTREHYREVYGEVGRNIIFAP